MSPAPTVLSAARRTELGKAAGRLRKTGRLPAVVFGHGVESLPVTLDAHEFETLRRHVHANAMIDLRVDDTPARRVLVHGVQIDPVTRRMLHVDLFEIRRGEEVTVDVPIVTVGTSEAVDKLGGTLLHNVDHLRIRALPDNLPEEFTVSIESLTDFDAAIHVREISIPAGVTVLTDPDEVVAKVAPQRVAEVTEAAPAPEEGEAEGAPEAGEGPTTGSERPERGAAES